MCDGGDISWQAQYFVRVRRVDAERFVAGAGNREVVSCGRGMSLSHWDWRVSGCRLEGLESRNCLAGLRDECALMGVSAGLLEEVSCETFVLQILTCEFLRKSRTKRSFWGLDM